MLKIKDGIELKELEKFGFYQSNEFMNSWNYELQVLEPRENNFFGEEEYSTLTVQEFEPDGKTKTNKELTLMVDTDDECWYNIDIIFDLIQAGLVEKI